MTNVTERVSLPTEEELTVKEVTLGYPYLKAGANHLGKYCEPQNNEFMLCRFETDDPRKCLKDGAAVTDCTLEFFSKVKQACPAELTRYAMCLEKSDYKLRFAECRQTGAEYNACMKEKMGMETPHFGYHALVKVHQSDRPKPAVERPAYLDDPRGGKRIQEFPDETFPHEKRKNYGNYHFGLH